jgi:hypothetical protein
MNNWVIKQTIKKILNKINFLQQPWWSPPTSSLVIDINSNFFGDYYEIYKKSENKLAPPTFLGTKNFNFMAEPVYNFDSIGVYQLQHATVS